MRLASIATATPESTLTQAECWEIARSSPAFSRLKPASIRLAERILTGESGIAQRGFAIANPDVLLTMGPGGLNRAFEKEAPALARRALSTTLEESDIAPASLDALFVCTCTGYLCPGISSHLAEQLGMRPDAHLADLVGLGCGAAIPTLRAAQGFLAAHPRATVACVAVEICSAAFYADDSPDQLISLCLFGDAANATLWHGAEVRPEAGGPAWHASDFNTHHQPADREKIRFVNTGGHLKNQLDRSVPKLSAAAVAHLFSQIAPADRPDQILTHGGGRDVLLELESALPGYDLSPAWEVLHDHGNCSSPSVLMALDRWLAESPLSPAPGTSLWLTSFGAGFSAHACRLTAR